jgi:hypothetical protein
MPSATICKPCATAATSSAGAEDAEASTGARIEGGLGEISSYSDWRTIIRRASSTVSCARAVARLTYGGGGVKGLKRPSRRPPQTSADIRRHPQTCADHRRFAQTFADLRSPSLHYHISSFSLDCVKVVSYYNLAFNLYNIPLLVFPNGSLNLDVTVHAVPPPSRDNRLPC